MEKRGDGETVWLGLMICTTCVQVCDQDGTRRSSLGDPGTGEG